MRTAPRVHGRVTRNNKPGIIPTSEGGGKRRRAEDSDWRLTKDEQERINEYKWRQVPTYEGGRKSKRVATSEGGAKQEQTDQEENFYDCLDEMIEETEQDENMYDCLSEDDEEDEEMEPVPKNDIIGELIVKKSNDEKKARNENKRRARAGRRRKRKERQILKEAKKVVNETKETLSEMRSTEPRRSPRLKKNETVKSAYEPMNLGANMHRARETAEPKQERPRQPYEPLPDMQSPRMFPPIALAAFNLRAMHIHEDARYTPQSEGMGQETSSSAADADIEQYCNAAIHPVTGEHITNYMKLKKDPATTEVWSRGFGKEFGGLA